MITFVYINYSVESSENSIKHAILNLQDKTIQAGGHESICPLSVNSKPLPYILFFEW